MRLGLACVLALCAAGVSAPLGADGGPSEAYERWRRHRPELRNGRPHAVWRFDEALRFPLRPGCPVTLAASGVRATRLPHPTTPAPEPVILEGTIGGVRFAKRRAGAPFVLACAMAARLPAFAAILREHGVTRVQVSSAYRREPAISYHHLGFAMDLTRFERADGAWVVEDWRPRPGPTCREDDTEGLRGLACALARSDLFSTVLTPEYGRGHDDHFHVDARPDDPWGYVR